MLIILKFVMFEFFVHIPKFMNHIPTFCFKENVLNKILHVLLCHVLVLSFQRILKQTEASTEENVACILCRWRLASLIQDGRSSL